MTPDENLPSSSSGPAAISPESAVGGFTVGLGRYRIESLAGKGGMGRVYKASDLHLQRTVALKAVISPDEALKNRLADFEAKTLASLDHRNILKIHDVLAEEDQIWIVSEWLTGESLEKVMARHGRIGELCLMAVAIQLMEAMFCMHAGDVIHRDIKPANIMLTREGVVKIIDFGAAFNPLRSTGETVVGSLQYTDPRIMAGERPRLQSDYYSAMITILELAAGEKVWPDLAPLPLFQFIEKKGAETLMKGMDNLHPDLESLLASLMPAGRLTGQNKAQQAPAALKFESTVDTRPGSPVRGLERLRASWKEVCPEEPSEVLKDALARGEFSDAVRPEAAGLFLGQTARALNDRSLTARQLQRWLSRARKQGVALAKPRRRALLTPTAIALAGITVLGVGWFGLDGQVSFGFLTGRKPARPPATAQETGPSALAAIEGASRAIVATEEAAPTEMFPAGAFIGPVQGIQPPGSLASPKATAELQVASSPLTDTTKPAKKEAAGSGQTLMITANAWADVFLDGAGVGRIPNAKGFKVDPGRRQLALKSPYIEAYRTEIDVGESGLKRLHVDLKRNDKEVTLVLPGKEQLFIDGKSFGSAERFKTSMTYGRHRFEVKRSDGSVHRGSLDITPSSGPEVRISF